MARFSGRVIGGNAVNSDEFVTLGQLGSQTISQYWQLNNGALAPSNVAEDLLIGDSSSTSALFHVYGNTGNTVIGGTLNVAGLTTINNSLALNSGTITTTVSTGNIFTTNASQINLGSTLSRVSIGTANPTGQLDITASTSGTLSALTLNTQNSSPWTLVLNRTDVANSAIKIINAGGIFRMYNSAGANINFAIDQSGNLTTLGNTAVNGGNLTSSASTFNLVNATPTTINFGGAATTLNIGAVTGITAIKNNLSVAGTTTLGGQTYTWPSSGGSNGYALTTNGSGTLSWSAAAGGVSNWQENLRVLAPVNITDDLAIGGVSTAAAKFQVFGSTGTASSSGNLTFAGTNPVVTIQNGQNLSFNTSAGGGAGTNRLTIASNGNIGIGTANPLATFQVFGQGYFTQTVSLPSINNTSSASNSFIQMNTTGTVISRNIADANVALTVQQINASSTGDILDLKNSGATPLLKVTQLGSLVVGNAALATTATDGFIYMPTSSGLPTGVPTSFTGTVAHEYDTQNNKLCAYNAGWKCSAALTDYAEWAPAAGASAGDIVTLTNQPNPVADATAPFMLGKATTSYDSQVVGVVSQYAEDTQIANGYKRSNDYHAIALVGRVPVKVSTINGVIHTGDLLTTSSIPGVAQKATQAGFTIGKATQDYLNGDSSHIGSIIVFVSPTYADPNVSITDSGNLSNLSNLLAASQNQQAQVNALNKQVSDLQSSVSSLQKQTVSLGSIQASPSATQFSDLQGQVDTLTKAVNLLMTTQMNANPLTGTVSTASTTDTTTLTNALTVTGKTTLADLGVTGTIQAGLLTIDGLNGQINTLAGELKLQATGLNGIDLENGKIKIDTDGNLISQASIRASVFEANDSGSNASVGQTVIPAGQTSITINTAAVKDTSKVFVTSKTNITEPLNVTSQKNGSSFTVEIYTPLQKDVAFNWWIVNGY